MFLALTMIVLITFGGAALTYLFAEDQPLLWRLSAGNIVGSAVFGIAGFAIACLTGLSGTTVLLALLITVLPLLLLKRENIRKTFRYDRQKAKSQFQGSGFKKFFRFLYYAGILIFLVLFFEQAMLVNDDGIFTGASQNLGDLPFHLGAIFSFTDGNNFPPENPSFANARFTYPFIADLITAFIVKAGAKVENAMLVQNVFFGFALVVLFEKFVFKLTNNKLAGKMAPVILLLSGGLGFLWFAKGFWESGKALTEFLMQLPRDYTIFDPPQGSAGQAFRWGNPLVVLFVTQRSLLFGMPLTLIVLTKIWEIFVSEKENYPQINAEKRNAERESKIQNLKSKFDISPLLVGLIAGTLPLIHAHSLFVLFVVTACLFFFRPDKWREWIAFGLGTAIVAVPVLLWVTTGSATHLSEFVGWHFGWDIRNDNVFWFWLKNTGIFIPLLIAGIVWKIIYRRDAETQSKKDRKTKDKGQPSKDETENSPSLPDSVSPLLYFYVPFLLLFIVSNTVKLAPWEWDNIKVLIYWFVGSIPFVALFLASFWAKDKRFKTVAAGFFVVLVFAGGLDVWRVISGVTNYNVFSKDAIEIARLIKIKTASNALFLNAPTYNSAVVLTGRRSLMRYSGHLSSHGIDYREREADLRRIYAGEGSTDILLRKYGIEYILLSPEVRGYANEPGRPFMVNEEFLARFPVIAEVGEFRVYKVK